MMTQNELWKIGNAQLLGSRAIQSNYFSTIQGEAVFAVLADGTIDHINGRRAAILSVETCMREFLKEAQYKSIETFFESLSMKILNNIRERIYRGKTPYISISMVYEKDDTIYYYSVGANRIFVLHEEDYICLKEQSGIYCKKPLDTVGLISEGVYEALDEMELTDLVKQSTGTFEKAQHIRMKINEKKKRQQKNATIILIEGGL